MKFKVCLSYLVITLLYFVQNNYAANVTMAVQSTINQQTHVNISNSYPLGMSEHIYILSGNHIMKVFLLLAATLISACSIIETVNRAPQPSVSDYQVGEKWVWKYKGVTDQGDVRADGLDTKQVINDNGILKISDGNNHIAVSKMLKAMQKPKPRYKWPLSAGKRWMYEEIWKSQDGTSGKTSQNVEVISYQKQTVAAGTFMAYTIHYKGNMTNSRGYSAETEEIILYAPKVKNFIKLTQKQGDYYYVEELIEYSKPD